MPRMTLQINSHPQEILTVTTIIRTLSEAFTDSQQVLALELALSEALNNTITHAYGDQFERSIVVTWSHQTHRLVVTVSDQGKTMNALPGGDLPEIDAERGRGWYIMKHCVDELNYHSQHGINTVTLVKNLIQDQQKTRTTSYN